MKRIIMGLCALVLSSLCSAQTYVPAEAPATPYRWLLDPEFNFRTNQVTWIDMSNGNIWVCGLDPVTGNLIPANGQGFLIEAKAEPFSSFWVTLNGPEWAMGTSSTQDYIVYTRYPQGVQPSTTTGEIAAATPNADGTWTTHVTTPLQRNAPYGSRSHNSVPKMSYNDAYGNHYVRDVANPATETALPMLTGTGLTPGVRFSDTQNIVVYPAVDPATGIPQVFTYDLDAHALTQLTYDAGSKNQPWVWTAPDYGNQMAMLTVINSNVVAIYTQQNGSWVQAQAATAPDGGTWFSTEPFVYQGKSYVLAQYTKPGQNYPSSIWVISFDPANPFMRKLTPDQPDVARADPEIVFTNSGPIVYFTRFDQTKNPTFWLCLQCMQGEYKTPVILP